MIYIKRNLISFVCFYLPERQSKREREKSCICWLIFQMPAAGLGQAKARNVELGPGFHGSQHPLLVRAAFAGCGTESLLNRT